MKKVLRSLAHITICIILLVNLICCSKPQYYTMEDFDFIVIGETTIKDIEEIFPSKITDLLPATSFGTVQDFPMEDGRFIEIKYMGPDMVVFSIEIVDEPF